MPPTSGAPERLRVFIYGTLLAGEPQHALLAGAEFLGGAVTIPAYTLVDLGPFPALVSGGGASVVGELYALDAKQRYAIDVHHQWPILFQRIEVELSDGTRAEAYAMRDEQVRGKRRLKHGSWRERFAPRPRASAGGPMAEWARNRFKRG
jgi:gamma-glutamylaminecyclotransferase